MVAIIIIIIVTFIISITRLVKIDEPLREMLFLADFSLSLLAFCLRSRKLGGVFTSTDRVAWSPGVIANALFVSDTEVASVSKGSKEKEIQGK